MMCVKRDVLVTKTHALSPSKNFFIQKIHRMIVPCEFIQSSALEWTTDTFSFLLYVNFYVIIVISFLKILIIMLNCFIVYAI